MKLSNLGLVIGIALIAGLAFLSLRASRRPTEGVVPVVNKESPGYGWYIKFACFRCHGRELEGTHKAPALGAMDRYWTPETLAAFLREPESFADDPRLADINRQECNDRHPRYRNSRHHARVSGEPTVGA